MTIEKIKTWLEVIAILIGSIWVVYTFGYKEWWVPNNRPVNITSNLSIAQVDNVEKNKSGKEIPVEISLTAHNPAERTIDLLDCIIIVSASKITKTQFQEDSWEKNIDTSLQAKTETISQLFFNPSKTKIIAVITPFRGTDTRLDPKEQLSRKHLVYLPREKFNHVEAVAILPNAEHESNISVKWSLDNAGRVVPDIKKLKEDGTKISITSDEQKIYRLQMTTTRSQLHIYNR